MNGFYLLNAYALIILSVLAIVFFSKKRVNHTEDNIYAFLLITCLITITCGVCSGFFANKDNFVFKLLNVFYQKVIWLV